jgi:hypothetical protein
LGVFVAGVMPEAWDLVFFYNGVEMPDKSVENIPAEHPVPVKGATMRRGGKVWIVGVQKTESPSSPAGIQARLMNAAETFLTRGGIRSRLSFGTRVSN